jgi:hypothetical protein
MNFRSTWRIIPLLLFLTACDLGLDELVRKGDDITANNFLSADKYTSLEIEVVYVEGFQPASASLDNLKKTLETLVNKPEGISIVTRSIASPGVNGYTLEKLKDIEKDHRVMFPSGNRLTAFIFFADKPYFNSNGSTRVLGLYYDRTSLAVFEKTVHDGSGGFGQPGGVVMETWVLNHEFGHALGLVNNGSPMQTHHEDPEKKGHCNNDSCIMHFESDARLLSGVPKFDDNCLADLKANGGK